MERAGRVQVAEVDVGYGDEDVQVLGAGDVDEEGQHREHMKPVEDLVRHGRGPSRPADRLEETGQRKGEGPGAGRWVAASGDAGGELPQHADHDGGDQPEDDQGVDLVALLELAGTDQQPVDERHDHPHQDQHADKVLEERQPAVPADRSQVVTRENPLDQGVEDGGQQDHEAVEDEDVEQPRVEVAEHPGMQADVLHDARDPLQRPVEAPVRTAPP